MAQILIIDDDKLLRDMLRTALELNGHDVVDVSDGFAAIKQYGQKPADLIITDIIMPGKDGIEIIFELHQANPDVKIIALSGGGRIEATSYLGMAEKFGASRTFIKPFDYDDLMNAIGELLTTDAPIARAEAD